MKTMAIAAAGSLCGDRLFDIAAARDRVLERFALLREKLAAEGFLCRTADMVDPAMIDVLVFHDVLNELGVVLAALAQNPEVRLLYIANEPPFVAPLHAPECLARLPVDRVLTWNDAIAGKQPHVIKCNIGQPLITVGSIPHIEFQEKKFICAIFANKPSSGSNLLFDERVGAVEFFARQPLGMDLYGIGWETTRSETLKSAYRGKCDSKRDILQRYRFSLAYENVKGLPGLITEKIFDCFAAGTVPVYLGAPNIEEYIPGECFVDARNFDDHAHMYEYLSNMNESEYRRYLDAAKRFLDSTAYEPFTSHAYVATVVAQIKSMISRPAARRSTLAFKLKLLALIAAKPGLWRNWRLYRRFLFTVATVW